MPEKPTRGLQLIADFGGPSAVRILRAGAIPYRPRFVSVLTGNRAPMPGSAEVVLELLDANRQCLRWYGMRSAALRFADLGGGGAKLGKPQLLERGDGPWYFSAGKGRRGARDLRLVRIPWPNKAVYLRYSRNAVASTPSVYRIRGLTPTDTADGVQDLRLDEGPQFDGAPWANDGEIVDTTPFVANPSGTFNIVVTGDGFCNDGAVKKFRNFAKRVMEGFGKLKPFSDFTNRLRWHEVPTLSKRPVSKNGDSFLRIKDRYMHNKEGFFGTDEPLRVLWVASQVVPLEFADLIIVLVNMRSFGGHAWPETRMAIVPLAESDDVTFERLAVHECAHVISRLADEAPKGVEQDAYRLDPNQVLLDRAMASVRKRLSRKLGSKSVRRRSPNADHVWWRALADQPGELTRPPSTFNNVHISGDKEYDYPQDMNSLGLFWGCQNTVDPDVLWRAYYRLVRRQGDESEQRKKYRRRLGLDSGDGYYFRPSGTCLMRDYSDFCRVCKHLLANNINEVACPKDVKAPFPAGWS